MSRYAYQNLNERIEKLKKHLKTRRGRRDLIALGTLVDIQHALAGRLTYDKANAMLRFYYNEESALLKATAEMLPTFAFFKKEGVKFKYEPVSLLPEPKPMSYMQDDDPPIKTGPASQAFRDNWDRVFGDAAPAAKSDEPCVVCGETGHEKIEAFGGVTVTACPKVPVDRPLMVPDTDEIAMTLKSYANLIVPLEAQIGPIEEPAHVEGCIVPQCPGCDDGDPEPVGMGYYTCVRCGNRQPACEGPAHHCPYDK